MDESPSWGATLTAMICVEDIDLGVTRQEGRVILRVIARSPELSVKIMGQRWAETRIWLKAFSYNHCYSRLVV